MSTSARASDIIVLSPHRDDAAFSCGLLLAELLAAAASVTIVNVCTVSDYAPYLPAGSAGRIDQVTNARAEEDACFADRIERHSGAASRQCGFINLGFKDAPLRWDMPAEATLEEQVRPKEVNDLAHKLRALPSAALILSPLAIGGHVDHLLVREAALAAFNVDTLLSYEDLPYACRARPDMRPQIDPQRQTWHSTSSSPKYLKRELASCYPSQVSADVCEELEQYAQRLGGCEHFIATPKAIATVHALLAKRGAAA